jgi:hypothetical protein
MSDEQSGEPVTLAPDDAQRAEDRYRLRLALIIGVVVVLVLGAIVAAVVVVNVRNAARDEHVRVACVTSGGDFYPQDGGKCVMGGAR